MKNYNDIFERYGIHATKINDAVFKVTNSNAEVNLGKLKNDIEEFIAITSPLLRYEKDASTGISTMIAHIYYIITDYSKKELIPIYFNKAKEEFGSVSIG